MVGAALGLVVLPDGRLFAVCVPLVLSLLLPSEETRLMNPLIGTPAEITAHFKAHPPKGEFVLIFNPQDKSGL